MICYGAMLCSRPKGSCTLRVLTLYLCLPAEKPWQNSAAIDRTF